MKKILYTILCLFLVSLMAGSVSAVAPTCITDTDNGIIEITGISFDPDAAYEPGDIVNLEIEVENTGTTPRTISSIDEAKAYVYYTDGTVLSPDPSPMTLIITFTTDIAAGDTETVEATWTVEPSDYLAYDYDNEHQFNFYVVITDNFVTDEQCDVSDVETVTLDNYPTLSGITSKTVTEDSIFSYNARASDADNEPDELPVDTLTFDLDANSKSKGMSIGSSTGIITWTPRDEHVGGNNNIIVMVQDGSGGSDTESFLITVSNTNDAPTLPTISTIKLQEGIVMNTLTLPVATDVDSDSGDIITYSLSVISPLTGSTFAQGYIDPITKVISGWNGWDPTTRIITGWTPAKADIGELKLKLTAIDLLSKTASQEFTINIYPKSACELGDIGNVVDVITIDSPSDGDSFGPGDTINIEATVENGAADDKDIIVKAVLYDIESNKKIEEVESDDENIDTDEDFNFELKLQIPLDDEEYGGDYVIYVKAYEDGKEDEQCRSEMVEIDLGRESHKVTIQSITITPSKVAPGNKVDVLVRAINTGKKEEAGVTVKLRNADLDIDLTSDARDLGAFDESGSSYTFRFAGVKIPSDASAKTYDLEAFVLFEEGAKSTSYIDSPVYKASSDDITVEGATTSTADLITIGSAQEIAKGVLRIPVTIANPDKKTLTVSLINIDWAEPVSEKTVTGDAETVNFDLELKDDVEEGSESFTVQVKANGEVVSTKAKSVSITEDMMVGSGFVFSYGTVLFVIGDIVLIIVAIFFIKLIFSGRSKRPKVREVKL